MPDRSLKDYIAKNIKLIIIYKNYLYLNGVIRYFVKAVLLF